MKIKIKPNIWNRSIKLLNGLNNQDEYRQSTTEYYYEHSNFLAFVFMLKYDWKQAVDDNS